MAMTQQKKQNNNEDYSPLKNSLKNGGGDNGTINTINDSGESVKRGKQSNVVDHKHDGEDLDRIDLRDIKNFIEVVPAAPSNPPKTFFDQIKIFINAGTPELHVYDYVNQAWRIFT